MVVNELRGEKIDIVPFSEDLADFVAKALSPAKVKEVIDPRRHHPGRRHRARLPARPRHRQGGPERPPRRPPHRLCASTSRARPSWPTKSGPDDRRRLRRGRVGRRTPRPARWSGTRPTARSSAPEQWNEQAPTPADDDRRRSTATPTAAETAGRRDADGRSETDRDDEAVRRPRQPQPTEQEGGDDATPEPRHRRSRTCVGCRRTAAAVGLVRCVVGPDGVAIVSRTAAGRGAWLCSPGMLAPAPYAAGVRTSVATARRARPRWWRSQIAFESTAITNMKEWTAAGVGSGGPTPTKG